MSSLMLARVMVIVLNIPLVFVATMRLQVISLFLVANMISVCATFPLVLGLAQHAHVDLFMFDLLPMTSFVISMLCCVLYGTIDVYDSDKV
jgi:hypothetical protein